jgi:PPOX class probable FMN-dependent enzyme
VDELTSVAELRTLYRDPGARGQAKVIHALDAHCRAFLAHCPFFVLATADDQGRCDASPRGGAAGFVHVLDDVHLAWGDLSGNHRLDSFQNLVANPHVGMLCMVPGMDETLRINGTASITTDTAVCERVSIVGPPARVAVVIAIDEAYVHCAKAFRRGGMWTPDHWPDRSQLPTAACMLRDHVRFDGDPAIVEADLEANYRETMWEPGGGS